MTHAPNGIMVALIGFNRECLEEQISQTPVVVVANNDRNAQLVFFGTSREVNTLLDRVKVRRTVPLNVSRAFCSFIPTRTKNLRSV